VLGSITLSQAIAGICVGRATRPPLNHDTVLGPVPRRTLQVWSPERPIPPRGMDKVVRARKLLMVLLIGGLWMSAEGAAAHQAGPFTGATKDTKVLDRTTVRTTVIVINTSKQRVEPDAWSRRTAGRRARR
jgi:hypothetical protein